MAGRPKGSKTKKPVEKPLISCVDCKQDKHDVHFYLSNSKWFKSTNGKIPVCKDCIKKSINYSDISTIYTVLQQMNLPFLHDIWLGVKERNPHGNILGVYIRQINSLIQYRDTTWNDSIFTDKQGKVDNNIYDESMKVYSDEWMGSYTLQDIEYLDNYLFELKKDFKIVNKSHSDYAKKIAKASLAMDKAYEMMLNGIGTEQKYKMMKEIFDTLSKSAQFTESERGMNDVSLGGFGVVFDKVEKNMYVPEHTPENKDMYDKLLDQFANINKSL